MSDYAGPILGAVGAVIGFVATGYNPQGAQWGWMIGSAIGGAYSASQQVIPGPKIGEVTRQTQQEGGFRPIVYGRSQPIFGNVIADSEPDIVRREESQGKGGPKVETESAYRTYGVGFCEGETTLLQAWRNGILVYDIEDPSMSAENAKFLEYAQWYRGGFDQEAAPELEEIYGAGNAPYFRGTSYLLLHREDVTDQRGAWSQWQVRVFRSAAQSFTSTPYAVKWDDASELSFRPMGGELFELLQIGGMPDALSTMLAPTGGDLSDGPLGDIVDEIEMAFMPTGGALAVPPIGEIADELSVTFAPTTASLHPAPVGEMGSDDLDLEFTPTGGSLHVP